MLAKDPDFPFCSDRCRLIDLGQVGERRLCYLRAAERSRDIESIQSDETMAKSQTEAATTAAPRWATLVATFFGAGRLRPGPGTWGSLAAGLLWWLLASHLPASWQVPAILLLIVAVTAIGIPAATLEARGCGKEDPSHVVIDEVAGQLVTLIACPILWKPLLAGFILFRAFDIVKPPPIRQP